MPAGLEAGVHSEISHGYLKVLPPKKQASEVRQVNAVREWVRNASSPGASER